MVNWKTKLKDIVSASQESDQSHDRFITELQDIYKSIPRDQFVSEFLRLIVYPLSIEDKSIYVDNCITFLVKFTVKSTPADDELDENDAGGDERVELTSPIGFFKAVVNFILKTMPSTSKTIRARGCQFLDLWLTECAAQNRNEAVGIVWDRVLESLIHRAKDKVIRVRCNAVSALSRMQQPNDTDCPAIKILTFLMRYDPSAEVRAQCVQMIGTTKTTIARLIERCRDPHESVRIVLYKQIAERKLFKYLKIDQRVPLMRHGLTDSAEAVRAACENELLPSWLEAVGDNIPELVNRGLDMVTSRKTCEMVLDALFKQKSPKDFVDMFSKMTNGFQNFDWVRPERVFCLRHFVSFIMAGQSVKGGKRRFEAADVDEWMDQLLPPLLTLVDFVEMYITKDTDSEELDIIDGDLMRNYTVAQFVELLILVDKSDVAGRKRMQKMFDTVVPVVNEKVLAPLVRLHITLYRSVERTTEWMSDVISDWTIQPTPVLPVRMGFPDQTVSFFAAGGEGLDEEDPENDRSSFNLFKSLTLLSEVLKLVEVKTLSVTLRSMYEMLVLPTIQNPDPALRNLAFRCLGLTCLLDRTLASKHVELFLQTLTVDVDTVRRTAIEVLFDLLMVFGARLFQDPKAPLGENSDQNGAVVENDKKKRTPQSVVAELEKILDSEDVDLHDMVAEGITKIKLFAPKLYPTAPQQAE